MLLLAVLCGNCHADTGSWNSGGPLATGLGDRVISALAISPDNNSIYCGTGSDSVFSLTWSAGATTTTTVTTTVPQDSSGSGSTGSGSAHTITQNSGRDSSSGRHVTSTGHGAAQPGITVLPSLTVTQVHAASTVSEDSGPISGTGSDGGAAGILSSGIGFPFTTAALAGAGSVLLIGFGWYIRRWWRYRQNPALFEEY
ncbi:MAG: hypothetical protein LUQ71_05605 [Methanoregula sp.]|nr:hypothetical protein [Methanoregula sp.]